MYKLVYPKEGKKVYDPTTNSYLPEEGRRVKFNQYWIRRLRDGDIVEAAAPKDTQNFSEELED